MHEFGLRGAVRAVARAGFPSSCRGCGRVADALCAFCDQDARAAPNRVPPPGIDRWWSPYAYVPPVRMVVADVKYRNRRAAVPALANSMVESLLAGGAVPADFDAVTWIPTTKRRRRARGFDHARLYAREVARLTSLPAIALLDRADDQVQTGRTARARRDAGPSFVPSWTGAQTRPSTRSAGGRAGSSFVPTWLQPTDRTECSITTPVSGGRLLLVDDVATTGTTLRNAAAVLRRSGAVSVSGLTAARALARSGGAAP